MRSGSSRLRSPRNAARVAVAIALACSLWLVASASSVAKAKHARKAAAGTVHVIEHAVTDTTVHSGGPGDHTGNLLTFHNKVFNMRDTKQVGSDQGYCVRISPAQGTWECNWTTFLSGGQITVEGPFYDRHNSSLAVTGGTGAYRRARGQMNLHSRHGGAEYDFVFELTS